MPEVTVKDIKNKDAGSISLSDELFSHAGKDALMHSAVINYLANQRQGTASTKGRSDVRGGGRKPHRQKGTGRARAGTNTSPIWRGGGIAFGPSPRDYSYSINKKAKRRALYAALSAKIADAEITVLKSFSLDAPKTKKMIEILSNLKFVQNESLIIVIREPDANVYLAARNIPAVSVKLAADLNAYDVLSNRKMLMTEDAIMTFEVSKE